MSELIFLHLAVDFGPKEDAQQDSAFLLSENERAASNSEFMKTSATIQDFRNHPVEVQHLPEKHQSSKNQGLATSLLTIHQTEFAKNSDSRWLFFEIF